jgi:MFS family permease
VPIEPGNRPDKKSRSGFLVHSAAGPTGTATALDPRLGAGANGPGPEAVLPPTGLAETRRAFFISHMVQEPFVAVYSMLGILLTKQLDASPFQVAVLTMLKPVVSVLSFYWGSFLQQKRTHVRANLLAATSFAVVPFLFAPLVDHAWFFVAAGAGYALFSRAAIPARMELLKINVPAEEREHLFSNASCLAYAVGVIASVSFGVLLDFRPEWWTQLVCVAACVSLFSIAALASIPDGSGGLRPGQEPLDASVKEILLHPWQATIRLLNNRPDFFHFQVGFFLAGLGLMVAMPAIPSFLTDLNVSYTELFFSLGVLKGLGFILTSNLWAKAIRRYPISLVSGAVFCGFGLFLICLLLAAVTPIFVLVAYGMYGIAQAGSHLVWNLSGPIFSGKETSFQYSSVNVLAIGMRGMVGPPVGGLIAQFLSPQIAIATGCVIGAGAVWYMLAPFARAARERVRQ